MARYLKRRLYLKRIKWYFRHIGYRVRHYYLKAVLLPTRIFDYAFGKFSYPRSPYACHMSYDEFAREHGRYGEFQLWRKAKRVLGKKAVWFRNLYLPKEDGTTLEIDLVAISPRGIFVFESKNYDGRIYGDERYPNWFQMIRKDLRRAPKKYPFFNPIMQNNMHCRHMARILEHPDLPIRSFVVFANRCVLKNISYNREKTVVCRQNRMARQIRKYKSVLTNAEVSSLAEKLTPFCDYSNIQKYKHIKMLADKHKT